jgi:hypothetical protein
VTFCSESPTAKSASGDKRLANGIEVSSDDRRTSMASHDPKAGGATALVVGLIACAIVGGFIKSCGNSRTPGTNGGGVDRGYTGSPPPISAPRDTTYRYWCHVNAAFEHANLPQQSAQQAIAALRQAARSVERAPVSQVDPAVSQWALRAASLHDRLADLAESSNSPAVLIEACIRGYNGDPFGVAIEVANAERQIAADYRAVRDEGLRVRAALSARYGQEFPPLPF